MWTNNADYFIQMKSSILTWIFGHASKQQKSNRSLNVIMTIYGWCNAVDDLNQDSEQDL